MRACEYRGSKAILYPSDLTFGYFNEFFSISYFEANILMWYDMIDELFTLFTIYNYITDKKIQFHNSYMANFTL